MSRAAIAACLVRPAASWAWNAASTAASATSTSPANHSASPGTVMAAILHPQMATGPVVHGAAE
ncbi:hypothetical protein [Actinokineospora sp. HUAS TT18]|uniref:hypothetical protein n=1 Tax=Actinokineospora sp. HUAS TT18 TaxID=3447451 RepID=UPI003F525FBF